LAVTLIGAGGIFTRIGRVGKLVYGWNGHQATVRTVAEALYDQYPNDYDLLGSMPAAEDQLTRTNGGLLATATSVATQTLIRMVTDDVPTVPPTVYDCLVELINQMNDTSDTVARHTCTAPVTALTNTGDGVLRTSVVRPDGLPCELVIAETSRIVAVTDYQSGTATEGQEAFTFTGEPNAAGVTDWDWPQGSAASVTFNAHDGSIDSLLSNGGFDTWVSSSPTDWTIASATEQTGAYDGGSALRLTAGATGSALQVLNDATAGNTLTPLTAYCVNFWAKASGALGAGELKVELVNGSGTVINNEAGTANALTVAFGSITTSWTSFSVWFQTPRVLTDDIDFRIRASVAFTGGSVDIDRVAMVAPAPRASGFGYAVFSGATKFVVGDGWTVASTNDRASATYPSGTWQSLFEILFGMSQLGLLLPSTTGAETVLDSLITA